MAARKLRNPKRSFSENKKLPFVKKRKYRKHPMPDQNAPKKPSPSAYHLFALEQGDILRKKGYSFQDIARKIGAMWRGLSSREVKHLESRMTQAKIKYGKDITAYRRSADYRGYQEYLKRWMAKEEAKKLRAEKRSFQSSLSSSSTDTASPTTSDRMNSPLPQSTFSATTIAEFPSPVLSYSTSLVTGESPLESMSSASISSPIATSLLLLKPNPSARTDSPLNLHLSPTSATATSSPDFVKTPSSTTSTSPELSVKEQLERIWAGDCAVTLAPDPLFPDMQIQPQSHYRGHNYNQGYWHQQHQRSSFDMNGAINTYPINAGIDDMGLDGSGLGPTSNISPFCSSTVFPEMLTSAAPDSIIDG